MACTMTRSALARLAAVFAMTLAVQVLGASPAGAVPAFAAQTALACQACHVGGFGPQLTPVGRNFKLHGYTQRMTELSVPLSAMAVASWLHTAKDQGASPAPGFRTNDNSALDQVSLFLAGGVGSHLGGFVQATYDGVSRTYAWDNVDLRLTTDAQLKGLDLVLGLSLNNSPGVQDPWNTLPAWGFPYTDSALAPAPAAAPLLSGALAQASVGLTAYAWINSEIYLEGGVYGSPGATTLSRLGADPFDPGDIDGLAPYLRAAWQASVRGGTLEAGAVAFGADIRPDRDRTTGRADRYVDLGLDASYQRPLHNGDLLTINGRYLHEQRRLAATCALAGGPGNCPNGDLDEARLDAAYYWRGKFGITAAAFDLRGASNPLLYPDARGFRPDSSGLMFQLDATPFGDGPQPARRANLRIGAQYTLYTRFDGAGAKASDNNTLRLFTWLAF